MEDKRAELGLSKVQFAKMCGISASTYNKVLKNHYTKGNTTTVVKIAINANISLDSILGLTK